MLLQNDRGRLEDATDKIAPGVRTAGMVTCALWSDFDNDDDLDLVVGAEWGPVRVYRNEGGRLADVSSDVGTSAYLGWWSGLAGGDLDGNGYVDYVACNVGLNTKYHATRERPTCLYFGDFEGNGRQQIVEAEYEAETLFPVRGRSCSSTAMPFLAEKFPTFRSFASADLAAIYTDDRLQSALRLSANTLETVVFMNFGDEGMRVQPLPAMAQIAPSFGAAVTDVDSDGHQDVVLVQNFFAPQPETGRMHGALGILLSGDGTGKLQPAEPAESGLVIPGDAKGLAVCDWDRSGTPDFAITQNRGRVECWENNAENASRGVTVRLVGRPGDLTAAGARGTFICGTMPPQLAELYAGSGYLSQHAPEMYFALQSRDASGELRVKWPDGATSTHTISGEKRWWRIEHPDR
jgi:hypothetical protein